MDGGILRVQKLFMILSNKWEVNTKSVLINKLCRIQGIFFESYFILFTLYLPFNLLLHRKCMLIFYELGGYFLHHTNIIIMNILFRKNAMKKTLKYIKNYEQVEYSKETQDSKDIYGYYSLLNARLGKYVIVFGTCIAGISWYVSTISYSIKENTEDCAVLEGVMYQVWYPFKTRYNWLSIIFDLSMAYIAVSMHIFNRMSPITLVLFQLAHIKILANKIRNIDTHAEELASLHDVNIEQALNIAVDECVKSHQEVMSLMDLLLQATKEMMLIGFFSSSMELASFIIQLFTAASKYHFIRCFIIFPIDLLQMLAFFWFADEIYVESTTLSNVIYNEVDWTRYTKPLRMKLIVMMIVAQKPIYFNATGIGEMTLEKFKCILNSCFSAVTFFQTMYYN